MNTFEVPVSSQSVSTAHRRCGNVAWRLCASTVCKVFILCQCGVDVVWSIHEISVDVVRTFYGQRPTSHLTITRNISNSLKEKVYS